VTLIIRHLEHAEVEKYTKPKLAYLMILFVATKFFYIFATQTIRICMLNAQMSWLCLAKANLQAFQTPVGLAD